jgi:ubiquinone/menaquinone biosynthesis C-methylase UbiE
MDIDETKLVNEVYEKISKHFHHTRGYKWHWIMKFIKEYNLEDREKQVIDIGCGNGRNMLPHFIGIDTCSKFVELCYSNGLYVIQASMTSIPLKTNSIDSIISIASFHHLSTIERRLKALKEMKRVLKLHGVILLSVWSIRQPKKIKRTFHYGDNIVPWNDHGFVYDRYYYIFRIEEIARLFEEVGLKVISHVWHCGNEVFILQN